jgi:hypothetical protein
VDIILFYGTVSKYAFEVKIIDFESEFLNKFSGLALAKLKNFSEIMAKIFNF